MAVPLCMALCSLQLSTEQHNVAHLHSQEEARSRADLDSKETRFWGKKDIKQQFEGVRMGHAQRMHAVHTSPRWHQRALEPELSSILQNFPIPQPTGERCAASFSPLYSLLFYYYFLGTLCSLLAPCFPAGARLRTAGLGCRFYWCRAQLLSAIYRETEDCLQN